MLEREPVHCHKQMIDDSRPQNTFPLLDKANWHLMLLKTGLECSSIQKRTALLVLACLFSNLRPQSCWKELVRRWHGIEGVSKIEVETYTLEPVFGAGK